MPTPALDPRLTRDVRVLVVDDDASSRELVIELLRLLGFVHISAAASGEAALERVGAICPQLIITDLMMPGIDGAELLRRVKSEHPTVRVVIMSVIDSVPQAVSILKSGADDYLLKPVTIDGLFERLDTLLAQMDVLREAQELRDLIEHALQPRGDFVWGSSRAMLAVAARIPALARTDAAVLVNGESGTGKELIARTIHYASRRAKGPMISVSCASIPDGLWEREFFGHVKGAFSDAGQGAPGVAAAAHGGTLFLDEVGEIPLPMQAKLLRFLQEKEVRPVGSTTAKPIDVRIVSATNRDLSREVAEGRFREDLFYRLHVLPLSVPALRERKEDVPFLASFFLKRYAREFARPVVALSPRALQRLCSHDFPGNVRELENVVQQAIVAARRSVVYADDIPVGDPNIVEEHPPYAPGEAVAVAAGTAGAHASPDGVAASSAADDGAAADGAADAAVAHPGQSVGAAPGDAVALDLPYNEAKALAITNFERSYVSAMLASTAGNVARAAREARLPRKSFARIMKRHNIVAGPDGRGGKPGRPRKDSVVP